MDFIFIDTETRSGEPLTNGVYRYVEDPEFMVTIITWALNDEPVETIDRTATPAIFAARYQQSLDRLKAYLDDPSITVIAHNAQFDRVVLRASGIDIPIERWHCTMARAMAHSLPGSLDKLCTIMKVPLEKSKDKRGREYIRLFCMPRPQGSSVRWYTKETHPDEWRGFLNYAGGDIEALRVLFQKLPRWNYGRRELAVYHLDQRINDRGIRVDTDLARAALDAADAEQRRLGKDTRRLTGDAVARATQRDALLRHILAVYGIDLPDLQAGTLERRLEDESLPDPVKELLRIRLMVSKTSTSKYKTLIRCVCKDERLRGLLAFCGAMRTGRWSGRLFQPQNLMRTPKYLAKIIDMAIESILDGTLPMWASNIMEVLAAAIRGALIASEGKQLICADLSNIEGRFAAWLAGEWWKVKAFEDLDAGIGEDLYILGYAAMYGVSVEAVKEDYEAGGNWRLIGKVGELACQYQGAAGAFDAMGKVYGLTLEAEHVRKSVKAWRRANPAIVKCWYDLQDAAIQAIALNGTEVICGRLLLVKKGAWLKIRLPSGRYLSYPHPEYSMQWAMCFHCGGEGKWMEDGETGPTIVVCPQCDARGKVKREVLSYMGVNQYTRKWERLQTYGGKLFENCLGAGTQVFTLSGWKRIVDVQPDDRLWDGESWVGHAGVVYQGVKKTIVFNGVRMTPDHEVWVDGEWFQAHEVDPQSAASSFARHHRAALCRVGGYQVPWHGKAIRQAEFHEQVYDVLNCGPRRRFVVRAGEGQPPFIVHNCVQAGSRDILVEGMIAAEQAGYDILLTIHDELVTEAPLGGEHSVEGLAACMTRVPEWALGLPLAAQGYAAQRYRKG